MVNKKCRIYAACGVSQTPIFELLFRGEDNKYEIFNLIIKKWSKIRMIFSKRIYSNRYIESQIVKGMSLLTEIYDLEKNMVYRRINNGKV